MRRLLMIAGAAALLATTAGMGAPTARRPKSKPATKPAAVRPQASAKFAAAATTWADIQVQVKDLREMVKAKRLDEIHPVAFEIRDLVRTLPDKSPALAPATRKKLEAQVRVMDRLAEQVDRYADAGKQAETVRQEQALLRTLNTIQQLYPAGSLKIAAMPVAGSSKERELYLTPGGAYTAADIKANGNQLPAQKFRGVKVSHDLKPNAGERICPITLTKANPGFAWIIGGKEYQFCCPPCVEEFVALAKKDPAAIKAPEAYVKQ